jgi:hypothetical protein
MNFFKKDPSAKLRAEYERLMKEAMLAQRAGDIVKSSELNAQAEKIFAQLPS